MIQGNVCACPEEQGLSGGVEGLSEGERLANKTGTIVREGPRDLWGNLVKDLHSFTTDTHSAMKAERIFLSLFLQQCYSINALTYLLVTVRMGKRLRNPMVTIIAITVVSRRSMCTNWTPWFHASSTRFYWDLFMLVLLIANLIILPVAISFFNDDLSTHWIVFNCISDTVFFLDIVINFRTGIFVEKARVETKEEHQGIILNDFADEIILDPRLIAKQYMKTWFFLDLLSSVPMDYIFLMWDAEADFNQLFHAGTVADTRQETPPYWQGDHSPLTTHPSTL
ncbi:potassium/sodium hyperpolarization-activated cyclic nucleotide-gated channel 2 [Elysia marginata]|uniref:Potassium/sodium hyperpolarization-activated cyclic nucleotide-gated channel 2 n=1 Tax=Elysia marginata TaxID=1093978 RepID=A0AAV4EC26_9GAST|nr:potassium/sodium hyperpolarization-activated cyclic nucleotide-gated channel 2 [Elysia marginata]